MNKTLLIVVAVLCGLLLLIGAALVGGAYYVHTRGLETYVVPGAQVNEHHRAAIEELGILEEGEEIAFLYSDAMFDVAAGVYLVTDRRLVLYDASWDEPLLAAPFGEIVDLEVAWDDSLLVDSTFHVTLADGEVWSFPMSSENGGDRVVHDYLLARIDVADDSGR